MKIEPRQLDQLSSATCSYASAVMPRTGHTALIVSVSGVAANDSANAGTYRFIAASVLAGLEAWDAAALVLDFRELNYTWGDGMADVLRAGERWHQPRAAAAQVLNIFNVRAPDRFHTAIVASPKCRDGLTSLLSDEMHADPARWLFESLGVAVAALDHRLTAPVPNAPPVFRDVYHLLDSIRERPGMHGIPEQSLRLLQVFLAGLAYGDMDDGDPPFWDFPLWMAVRAGVAGTSMPLRWLETSQPDDQAYHTYFRLLDDYRRCRVEVLARLPGSLVRHRPTTHYVGGEERPYVHPVADTIILARYAPSDVYFAAEVFANRTVTLTDSVQPTVEAAMDAAKSSWLIDPAAWKLSPPK